jgi:hypothetical protein
MLIRAVNGGWDLDKDMALRLAREGLKSDSSRVKARAAQLLLALDQGAGDAKASVQ